ncbi:MAG TPA: hypothetical protein VMQ81_11435 [Acidimicrobiia bacterium]|nr:hypothetical protein [Acidimicrobiia bacterium]
MGMFKDLKNTVQQANEAAATAQEIGAQQQGIASGATPYPTGDPAFEPIEGVDLDTYAKVTGLLGKNMIMGPENVENYAAEHGVPKGTWQKVMLGWTERIQKFPQVSQRFGVIMSQHSM